MNIKILREKISKPLVHNCNNNVTATSFCMFKIFFIPIVNGKCFTNRIFIKKIYGENSTTQSPHVPSLFLSYLCYANFKEAINKPHQQLELTVFLGAFAS